MTTRTVFWSPDPGEVTGQAVVTRRVMEMDRNWVVATFPTGGGLRALLGIGSVFKAWGTVLTGRAGTVYVVCSRSSGGFLRDVPALALARLGARVLVHTHGSDLIDLLRRRRIGWLARFLYRACEVIVPSRHLIDELRPLCRSVHLCENFGRPNAISLNEWVPSAGVTVLWNSNLMASKGVRDLVAGCERARANHPHLRLVMLGRPISDAEADREEMATWVESLAGQDWLRVEGSVSHESVLLYLAEADVVALPSRYSSECQPLALIDAMCAGKAVIAADTPALRATVGDYPSQLCTSDANGIANALAALCTGPTTSSALRAGAAYARARFAPERFDRDMAKILDGVEDDQHFSPLG